MACWSGNATATVGALLTLMLVVVPTDKAKLATGLPASSKILPPFSWITLASATPSASYSPLVTTWRNTSVSLPLPDAYWAVTVDEPIVKAIFGGVVAILTNTFSLK